MKWVIRIVAGVVLLLIIAVVVVFWQVDRIATAMVQKGTSYATQCEVEIDKVDISILGGEAEIHALDVKNPTPFREIHDSFLKVNDGKAGVSFGSLLSDKVEIPEVVLEGTEISLIGRDGKTNYETVLESLARLKKEEKPGTEEEKESGKEFVIRTVRIPPAKVYVDMDEDPALGLAPVKLELTLKEIVLTDVGSGGVPLSQISADLIADILVQVIVQLGDQLGSRVLSGLTSGLAGVLGGTDELQAQITAFAADLNIASTVDVAEQLKVAERLGTVVESARDLIPEAGDLGGRVNDLIPGQSDNEDNDNPDNESNDESPNLRDRIRGL